MNNINHYIWHHPIAYGRVLKLAMATVLVLGLYASVYQPVRLDWNLPSSRNLEMLMATESTGRAEVVAATSAAAMLPPYGGPIDSVDARAIARRMASDRFGDQHWTALERLWTRESGWNPHARNPRSGACGIPQALPCGKITDMSVPGQIEWGISYIARRYGNPTNAWRHFLSHGWY